MLLEWGHTQYFNDTTDHATLVRNTAGITEFYEPGVTKEQIHAAINRQVYETRGNYDGMLGIVTNFNYSLGQDGGWECSVKLIGLGSIMETQRLNGSYVIPKGLAKYYGKAAEASLADERKAAMDAYNTEYNKAIASAKTTNEAQDTAFKNNNPIRTIDGTPANESIKGQRLNDVSFINDSIRLVPDLTKDNKIQAGAQDYSNWHSAITKTYTPETNVDDKNVLGYYVNGAVYLPFLGDKGFVNPLSTSTSNTLKGDSNITINSGVLDSFSNLAVLQQSIYGVALDIQLSPQINDKDSKKTYHGFAAAVYYNTYITALGVIGASGAGDIQPIGKLQINPYSLYYSAISPDYTQDIKVDGWGNGGILQTDTRFSLTVAIKSIADATGTTLASDTQANLNDIVGALADAVEAYNGDLYFKVSEIQDKPSNHLTVFVAGQDYGPNGEYTNGGSYFELAKPIRIYDDTGSSDTLFLS